MLEIERKYIVESIPENLCDYDSFLINQSYLNIDPEVRIRKSGEEHFLTIKSDGSLYRNEVEIRIDEDNYLNLIKMAKSSLEKKRYLIPDGDMLYELDIYHNISGLITVEVEFRSEEEAMKFNKPKWFGEELTFIKEFKCNSLARYGKPMELKCLECNGDGKIKSYNNGKLGSDYYTCRNCEGKGSFNIESLNLESYNNYAKRKLTY